MNIWELIIAAREESVLRGISVGFLFLREILNVTNMITVDIFFYLAGSVSSGTADKRPD